MPDCATTPLCHFATLSICRICTLMIYNNNIIYYIIIMPLCHFATLSICRICTLMIYNNNIIYYIIIIIISFSILLPFPAHLPHP